MNIYENIYEKWLPGDLRPRKAFEAAAACAADPGNPTLKQAAREAAWGASEAYYAHIERRWLQPTAAERAAVRKFARDAYLAAYYAAYPKEPHHETNLLFNR